MVLPAYLMSCLYLWKLCVDKDSIDKSELNKAFLTSVMGSVYALWLIYAAGLSYLLMAVVFIALGIPVYMIARKEQNDGQPVFKKHEQLLVSLFIILAIFAVYAFVRGIIKI